jgi:hypothetical protein
MYLETARVLSSADDRRQHAGARSKAWGAKVALT